MRTEININTDIIPWAITRAGFELQDFLFKVPNTREWMNGNKKPTVKQLEDFSKKVHLPFGYFFLPEPPQEKLPIPFFRTGNPNLSNVSINVYDTILILQQRQDWLKNYLKDIDCQPLPFVGRYRYSNEFKDAVTDIRKTLGLHVNWASDCSNWVNALNTLTQKIEESGIILIFNSIVENNTHRPIKVEECRGFVLVDKYAPFMFINNEDSKTAQMFTIVHELAHIWLGQSAGFDFRKMQPANDPIELLCDKIAAEFLVPENSFNLVWKKIHDFKLLAKNFKVSEIVIARRALDMGKITKKEFFTFYEEYINSERTKGKSSGGDFYASTKKRLSLTFAAHINNAVRTGKLLYRDAYRLTGFKGATFQIFFSKTFNL